jgi:hypothetical protein
MDFLSAEMQREGMAKGSFAIVEERYRFELPEVYRSLSVAGHFDHRGMACLALTDVE